MFKKQLWNGTFAEVLAIEAHNLKERIRQNEMEENRKVTGKGQG